MQGLGFSLEAPLENVLPYLDQIDLVLMMGTSMGIKGQDLDRRAYQRLTQMREIIFQNGCQGKIKIEADGGIRSQTVPQLQIAGADLIVPGSLVFKSKDLGETFTWLHSLSGEDLLVDS